MPLHVLRLLALGLTLAAGTVPALASEANFDFTIAGIKVGVLVLGSEQSGNAYTATSRIETAGIISIFADFFFDGQSSGRLGDDGTVVPKLFTATSKSPRALRHTRIDWQAGTPVFVSVEPPRSSAPDPADQGGTLDPVSATFRLFRDAPPTAICNTTVTVFDGSRLSRLKLAPPVDGDDGLTCEGIYTRVAGEAHAMAELPEFPFRMVFSHTADGLAQLERIEAPTSFGRAVIARHG